MQEFWKGGALRISEEGGPTMFGRNVAKKFWKLDTLNWQKLIFWWNSPNYSEKWRKYKPLVPRDFSGIENFKLNQRSMVRIEGVGHHFKRYNRQYCIVVVVAVVEEVVADNAKCSPQKKTYLDKKKGARAGWERSLDTQSIII